MIIVRLLSPGPFGWLAPPKFTRVQGADIVMESITQTSGRECKRLTSAPCAGRLHWPGTHESTSTGDQHFDSAALRTAASISCRIRPLNGLISIQYARKRRLVAVSAHNTRVSVLSCVAPSARVLTSKFHAAFAVPAGAVARNRTGLVAH